MALDYRKCAQEIIAGIGGRENVAQAAHCATRLRLVIKDNSKVNKEVLEEVDGVKGLFESNNQLQLIIGTGTVNKVYEEFLDITGMTASTKDDVKAAAAQKAPIWQRILKPIGDVFVPILPAIVATGLLMGLVEALAKIPGLGFAQSPWAGFLGIVSNTAFVFLPALIAVSSARVFGANPFLAAVMGLMMIHPDLLNGWNAGNTDAINSFFQAKDNVFPNGEILAWNLFGPILPVPRMGYQGHVIPVILSIYTMAKIEKTIRKAVPEILDLFLTPLCTLLLTSILTFTIIGPIFASLETFVLSGAEQLVKNPFGAMIMGGIYPITVVMGLHHMYNVIESGMLSNGLNTWMPIATAANFAQFGACLAIGLKSTNQKTKAVAIPSSLSAALGITEPAIFGVNLRMFQPFVFGMAGGAAGALFASFLGLGATTLGVTGVPGYVAVQTDKIMQYTLLLAVSGGIAFILTWLFWKEEAKKDKKAALADCPNIEKSFEKEVKDSGKNLSVYNSYEGTEIISSEAGKIYAPVKGRVVAQSEILDKTFAEGILGRGVGILPEEEMVYAPVDGIVSSIADSKHAIGIIGPNDMEILIHVGVDTVSMNGDGFKVLVSEDQKVTCGQPVLMFDRAKIQAANHSDVVVVLLTNSDDYQDVKTSK